MSDAANLMIELAEARFYIPVLISPRAVKPGASYLALPPETKRVLQGLTSADVENVRWPPIDGYPRHNTT